MCLSLAIQPVAGYAKIITSGLPGQQYEVQYRDPEVADWQTATGSPVTALANGLVTYTKPSPIAEHGNRMYRLKHP